MLCRVRCSRQSIFNAIGSGCQKVAITIRSFDTLIVIGNCDSKFSENVLAGARFVAGHFGKNIVRFFWYDNEECFPGLSGSVMCGMAGGVPMNFMKKLFHFLRFGKCRELCIKVFFLSAFYRLNILGRKPERLHRNWGERGAESSPKESEAVYRYAGKVAYSVEMVCDRTPWKSKCLVRALCARHLLHEKGITTTLYLGCGKENGRMSAHAWLRCGELFVTGGNGAGYAVVDKYRQ